MAAFELTADKKAEGLGHHDPNHLREESIIAHKIYDSCRQQDCLTVNEIGPARAADDVWIDGHKIEEGEIIVPPRDAVTVTIDDLDVKKIIIVNKKPSPFKKGFWEISVRYVFEYCLTFRKADGDFIQNVKATSTFNKKVTLFGSVGSDLVMGTDLHKHNSEGAVINAEPFVWVEANAVALAAEIRFGEHSKPKDVAVTIGLFTIISLFRIVNLKVESRGFNIPRECDNVNPTNPCDFFDALDFPMDIFAPPQRHEFTAGISGNIPRSKSEDNK